mmetsp:Transcript_14750/g.24394  ORF Transcript_14750/g.24394 Transcript_14750/m.24394 type:complete len:236 (-) Transcript_14750:71-778(-)|eukprot:CAMPEP_0119013520 /NCGR_PEP_ID=MMETSP1176-20130426/8493_1 /TAXON_ID=265551 /ORGANISM="Synedropsis recta cf, Strain CCMP1620" /LENGTH=235 /DNA_ID=CAMNT_0006966613 /DNA_START=364 /DNA_END=1071 /DNA_ORIENTATION=+
MTVTSTTTFGLSESFYNAFFSDNDVPFCTTPDDGMIMYMDGFRSSLSTTSTNPCLNLYFITWTLNTRAKFGFAMIGIVALGVITEGISKLRSLVHAKLRGTTPSLKRWSITILHGLQALVGYILMLATMTFSVELLACVIFGLGLGFAIFYTHADGDDYYNMHVTTNPCCNFLQEEFYERASTLRRQSMADQEAARQDELPLVSAPPGDDEDEQQGLGVDDDEALRLVATSSNTV